MTLSFVLCFFFFVLFLYRRASVAYLWRSLHLIEDLVLEKRFLSKIDMPLKLLFLTLLVTPLIVYLPSNIGAFCNQLALFLIPFLAIHVVIQGFDLIVFQWYFEKHKEANVPAVFRVIVVTMLYVLVLLVLLQSVYRLNILPVIATSTVMTAVLGLAMQDTLKNLFAGLTISLEKRFMQGDWIALRLDSAVITTGEISEIGWRTIRLRMLDDNYTVVPNATFTNANITNFSRPLPNVVRTVEFPIPPTSSLEQVSQIILSVARKVEGVLQTPPPVVTPLAVKLDQVTLRLKFWISNFPDGDAITGAVIEQCFTHLQRENLLANTSPPVSVTVSLPAPSSDSGVSATTPPLLLPASSEASPSSSEPSSRSACEPASRSAPESSSKPAAESSS
jgi:small-conductance mechanosensitive channel